MVIKELGSAIMVAIFIMAFVTGIGYRMYSGMPDSKVEEACERIIEKQLDLDQGTIDLSPDTPDPDDKESKE